ncbi:hypothetical protein LCGC14_2638370 [marine sediment metagenome]|uniref:Uncharacterized protein n=1 Tax=marine sediment metagenome TaxID=412755 RepID=A0A0F9AKS9_9ZZZZ
MKKFTVNFRQKSNPFSRIIATEVVYADTWEEALQRRTNLHDTWHSVLDADDKVIITLEQYRYGGKTSPFTGMPVKKGVAHI